MCPFVLPADDAAQLEPPDLRGPGPVPEGAEGNRHLHGPAAVEAPGPDVPDRIPVKVYEPFLIQEGFLMRTPRGRVATVRAYERFGYEPPTDGRAGERGAGGEQSSLFE